MAATAYAAFSWRAARLAASIGPLAVLPTFGAPFRLA